MHKLVLNHVLVHQQDHLLERLALPKLLRENCFKLTVGCLVNKAHVVEHPLYLGLTRPPRTRQNRNLSLSPPLPDIILVRNT